MLPDNLLTEEDLFCPHCGAGGDYWIREVASRASTQPFQLILEDNNTIGVGNWDVYETGDDTADELYQCGSCFNEWPSFADLREALVASKHVRQDAAQLHLPEIVRRIDRPKMALAVLILDHKHRLYLEKTDPMALKQAREALGLGEQVDVGVAT